MPCDISWQEVMFSTSFDNIIHFPFLKKLCISAQDSINYGQPKFVLTVFKIGQATSLVACGTPRLEQSPARSPAMTWQPICVADRVVVVVEVVVVVLLVVVVVDVVVEVAVLRASQAQVFRVPSVPVTVHLFCALKPLRA